MNLPQNVSAAAAKVYQLLTTGQKALTTDELSKAYTAMPDNVDNYKAIATADSLVVKGILKKETGTEDSYVLLKTLSETGPDDTADASEEYAKKTDTNAEEKRMIAILEKHDKRLPEATLFQLYAKEQMPASDTPPDAGELSQALQELEAAGAVEKEGETYRAKS